MIGGGCSTWSWRCIEIEAHSRNICHLWKSIEGLLFRHWTENNDLLRSKFAATCIYCCGEYEYFYGRPITSITIVLGWKSRTYHTEFLIIFINENDVFFFKLIVVACRQLMPSTLRMLTASRCRPHRLLSFDQFQYGIFCSWLIFAMKYYSKMKRGIANMANECCEFTTRSTSSNNKLTNTPDRRSNVLILQCNRPTLHYCILCVCIAGGGNGIGRICNDL